MFVFHHVVNFSFLCEDLGAPDGIAYDWINKRIYYSDYINQTISSMAVDGSQRTVVAQVPRPRAIMLDPCRGFVSVITLIIIFSSLL